MRFHIPTETKKCTHGNLYIGELLLATFAMDQWVELSASDGIQLSKQPLRDRFIAAFRLLINVDGQLFANKRYRLYFDGVDADHKSSDNKTLIGAFTGEELLQDFDIVTSREGIVDGAPARIKRAPTDVRVLAFYLPQFYPFAENDKWWGEGFTEWANVVEAQPQLPNHNMPLLPADLGFYDLRVIDTRRRQSRMADEYGVDGFCYYFYWFNGRRIMREVLDAILASGVPEKDFCLCWANESWSRRWDGSESAVDLLIKQEHSPEIDMTLIDDLIPYFLDERYIKIWGLPLLLVYRLDIMRDARNVIAAWKQRAQEAGFPGLFVAAVRSFGLRDEDAEAVDAIVEFPPHTAVSGEIQHSLAVNKSFAGKIYDYRQVVINAATKEPGTKMSFPGVMPRWDNTPRKAERSHFFWNSTPGAFKIWLSMAFEQAKQLTAGANLLFINSWNEWGEGAMLEPDRVYGRAYLEALRSIRGGYTIGPEEGAKFSLISSLPVEGAEAYLRNFAAEVNIVAQIMAWRHVKVLDTFRIGPPELLTLADRAEVTETGLMIIDHSSARINADTLSLQYGQPLSVVGWAMAKERNRHVHGRIGYFCLIDPNTRAIRYHTPVLRWNARRDVADYYNLEADDDSIYYGFDIHVGTDNIVEGTYKCAMLQTFDNQLVMTWCPVSFERVSK